MKNQIYLILLFLSIGCASQKYPVRMEPTKFKSDLNSLVGKTENDIRLHFGPPNEIIDNGDVGKVFVYRRPDVIRSDSQGSSMYINKNIIIHDASPIKTTTVEYYVRFWLDNSGTITRWDSSGFEMEHDINAEKRNKAKILDGVIWGTISGILFFGLLMLAG